MSALDLARLVPEVRAIAREAGEVILRYYKDPISFEVKADGSPVTDADLAAEAVILPALHHLTPGIPVVAEESFDAGARPVHGDTFWLVDALDGTRAFIEHSDEFTVNIGLVVNGHPELGVIYIPAEEQLYWAAGPGTAAWSTRHRSEHPIATRQPAVEGLVVLTSRRHSDDRALADYLAHQPVLRRDLFSSSLKFCLIARGMADLYPRFGATCEWDTAAGHAILAAAGGRVETLDGAPLLYGKPGFDNPSFIAYGR
ncbi:MAG: 3'(2'),5'-bisphosphate nucleotidase CysQ [Azospirillaceae bacterium]|nr:3'(2'),5'-bisphosphate nucleotidase CysQ [Azospirillaceae bacterium]